MPLFYQSGEQIKKGDRVVLHDNPAEVEFVSDPEENPEDWYVRKYGGGLMIREPKIFGRLFLTPADNDYAELRFVSRSS